MKIHLIRHGVTEANAQKKYCGSTDLPLSSDGIRQLEILKARNTYPEASLLFTSGLKRAEETLRLIYGDVPAVPIRDLREYAFGEFEMKTYEELKTDPRYIAWITDQEGIVACPGGESKKQAESRILRGFHTHLIAAKEDCAAIVHGGTIVTILSHLFPNERDFYAWQPQPGLGYTLCRGSDGLFTYKTIEGEVNP